MGIGTPLKLDVERTPVRDGPLDRPTGRRPRTRGSALRDFITFGESQVRERNSTRECLDDGRIVQRAESSGLHLFEQRAVQFG